MGVFKHPSKIVTHHNVPTGIGGAVHNGNGCGVVSVLLTQYLTVLCPPLTTTVPALYPSTHAKSMTNRMSLNRLPTATNHATGGSWGVMQYASA